ncbi:hypothetical protein [Nocardioides pantholopis]|uniref:hypothetical protein n=1 Tax=Nocardioides pantholopis TaxID=2483798 RepID=UPI0019D1CD72|nr:hypothetical protein [Nocardioides pantholopis]
MVKKLSLLVAAGAGYVLGARAGRERYEQIKTQARKVAGNPKVQDAAHKAQDAVAAQATAAAGVAKDKASDVASSAAGKVRGNSSDDAGTTGAGGSTGVGGTNSDAPVQVAP